MKCVVTGANGLIGKAVVSLLEAEGWQIDSVGRSNSSASDAVKFACCDFSHNWTEELLPSKADAVIHLAQSEHFRNFPERAQDIFNVNTMSTVKLLEYARKVGAKTFILASSGGIYGYGDEGFKEDEPIKVNGDINYYLGTKLCSEILVENYAPFMNIVILRFFFVYGPEQRSSMLIPRLVQSVIDGKPIVLQGQDGIRINPTYVTDAAEAVLQSLKLNSSQKINVGGPEILSLRQVGETIAQIIGNKAHFQIQPEIQPRNLVGDINKMTNLLSKPQVSIKDGIKKLCESKYKIHK